MSHPYPVYEEQEECKKPCVIGSTVATHRGKQETKGNLKGAFWSSILASAVLNLQQIIQKSC